MLVQFNNRSKFNLAIGMITDKKDLNNIDIGHADMLVSFFKKETFTGITGEWSVAQIWDKPSFYGPADYQIVG